MAPNARLEARSSEEPSAAAAEVAVAAATLAAPEQEDPQVLALRAFAATLGYVVQKVDTWTCELAHMIASRMIDRLGAFVHQSAAFQIFRAFHKRLRGSSSQILSYKHRQHQRSLGGPQACWRCAHCCRV